MTATRLWAARLPAFEIGGEAPIRVDGSHAAVWRSSQAWSRVVRSGSWTVPFSSLAMAYVGRWRCSATILIGMFKAVRQVRRVEASMPLSGCRSTR